jgi:hypothetical protein
MRNKAMIMAAALCWASGAALAQMPPMAPPAYLTPEAKAAFNSYLASPVGKAFAAEPSGGFSWVAGIDSSDAARRQALEACQRSNPGKACAIISVDGQPGP